MTIFRSKKNNMLYTIEVVSPMKYLGSWLEAVPFMWNGKILKDVRLKDFVASYVR